jgi:hypothetical protein
VQQLIEAFLWDGQLDETEDYFITTFEERHGISLDER